MGDQKMHEAAAQNPSSRVIHAIAAIAASGEESSQRISAVESVLREVKGDERELLSGFWIHGLAGTGYQVLAESKLHHPESAGRLRENLRPLFLTGHALTLANLHALELVTGILLAAGIPLLVMQGAALLARAIYTNPESRPMSDVDLLVGSENLEEAASILTAAGLERPDSGKRWIVEGGVIDLHTAPLGMDRIASRRLALPLDAEMIWDNASPVPPGSAVSSELLVPSRPMLWAMGLAHAQKHSFSSLIWLIDLARLADAMPFEEIGEAQKLTVQFRLSGACTIVRKVMHMSWNLDLNSRLVGDPASLDPSMSGLVERAVRDIHLLNDTRFVGERLLWRMAPDRLSRFCLKWESVFPDGKVMKEIFPGYRPLFRPWYMLRRSWDLLGRLIRSGNDR